MFLSFGPISWLSFANIRCFKIRRVVLGLKNAKILAQSFAQSLLDMSQGVYAFYTIYMN